MLRLNLTVCHCDVSSCIYSFFFIHSFKVWYNNLSNKVKKAHWGIFGLVPLWDGHMMVEHFARDPLLGLSFPQYRIEIRKVMVNVYSIIAPSTKWPATELWSLNEKKKHNMNEKLILNSSDNSFMIANRILSHGSNDLKEVWSCLHPKGKQ